VVKYPRKNIYNVRKYELRELEKCHQLNYVTSKYDKKRRE
jgi:hypothetical protein